MDGHSPSNLGQVISPMSPFPLTLSELLLHQGSTEKQESRGLCRGQKAKWPRGDCGHFSAEQVCVHSSYGQEQRGHSTGVEKHK
jgi:hypothetical protein